MALLNGHMLATRLGMKGQLEFHRVTEGPDWHIGLYAGASPTEAHIVCELWGGHKIDRKWPKLHENALATLQQIDEVGNGSERTVCYYYQEGANIEMGRGMVLLHHDYQEWVALLSVAQAKQVIDAWVALLLARPHKGDALPEPIVFDYLADGAAAAAMFASAFKE